MFGVSDKVFLGKLPLVAILPKSCNNYQISILQIVLQQLLKIHNVHYGITHIDKTSIYKLIKYNINIFVVIFRLTESVKNINQI